MIKVFLVEDEYIIREGIKKNIDWASNGFEFCGEAADGELAYPLICKEKPDIVITDIKMPFMNGLELSRLIRKELPDTEIIILSGYEEFDYAKEAIKLGVAEYLLKPISGDELLDHVNELAVHINEKRHEKELYNQYRREMEQGYSKERRDLFDDLVTGEHSVSELMSRADKLDVDITAVMYNILLLKFRSCEHDENEYSNSVVNTENNLEMLAAERKVLLFDRDPEGKALIFKADSREELIAAQNSFIEGLREMFARNKKIRYFGGLGIPVGRIRELPASFESASRAFAHRYMTDESSIVSCDSLDSVKSNSFDISNVNLGQLDRQRLKDFLKTGDSSETKYFVGEFIDSLGNGAIESNLFRQYIALDTYFCVAEFLEGLQQSKDKVEIIASDGSTLSSVEKTVDYISRILGQAIEVRDSVASNRYDAMVENVMSFIDENFGDEDLAISTIAAHVNFSPNHLSMVFRQQTGQTLIKYLTDYRLNKAKELLKCTSLRSSEIGLKCGYKDPHYFSYLFKKTLGVTPTQYREG